MFEVLETVETAQDATAEALEAEETGREKPRWHQYVALSTMIKALLAVVVDRKFLWVAGLAIGVVGAFGVIAGVVSMLI